MQPLSLIWQSGQDVFESLSRETLFHRVWQWFLNLATSMLFSLVFLI
jgi:hypothetical protein